MVRTPARGPLRKAIGGITVICAAAAIAVGYLASAPAFAHANSGAGYPFTKPTTVLASVSSDGVRGSTWSDKTSVSADGRYVAFVSGSGNLVPGDTNVMADVFVRDLQTGATQRVSVSSSGTQANGWSDAPSLSADGRFVAFHSGASNLVPGDTNEADDVFVRDLVTGQTTRVSVSSSGGQANAGSYDPSISADGMRVAFRSSAEAVKSNEPCCVDLVPGDSNGMSDVFLRDLEAGTTTRMSVGLGVAQPNGWSDQPAISADGNYVAFRSTASNLVSGDTNGAEDIFLRVVGGTLTTRVSVSNTGLQANNGSSNPVMSRDGRYVGFDSWATNLVTGDTNKKSDVFTRDRLIGRTIRISISSGDAQANDNCYEPAMSSDGRVVAFHSDASSLVSGDTNAMTDVFVRDTLSGVTDRASLTSTSGQASADSYGASLSGNGRYTGFTSNARNLVAGDSGLWHEAFVRYQLPSAWVGTPAAPSNVYRSKYFSVSGLLKPRHSTGSPVRVYKYRQVSRTAWKSEGYIVAKASSYSTWSKYSASMRLTTRGKWRLRAYHPADSLHPAMWSSSYRYVTVK